MIDALLNKYNKINLNRVYLTGISAGGWSTMQYIATKYYINYYYYNLHTNRNIPALHSPQELRLMYQCQLMYPKLTRMVLAMLLLPVFPCGMINIIFFIEKQGETYLLYRSIYAESESLGRANRDAVQHYNNCPNKTFTAIGTAIPGAQAGT